MADTAEQEIADLHRRFILANTREEVSFLHENAIGPDLLWFNLNKSNYIGTAHIVKLWTDLHASRAEGSKDAVLTTRDDRITVVGDVAWVTDLINAHYDFGDVVQFHNDARGTEVWQRVDGRWLLAHFHCSEYQPGVLGGV